MFDVVETKHATLLSLDTCLQLNLITMGEQVHLIEVKVEALIKEYEDIFIGSGCLPGEYDVVVDKEMPPVQNRPRKVAFCAERGLSKENRRTGAKTIKKNTNSTQNKSETHHAKQYEITSFLSTDCELSTETCSKNVYSLGPWRNKG